MFPMELKKFTKISITLAIMGMITLSYFCINTFTHHQIGNEIVKDISSIVQSTETCCSTTFSTYSESLKSNFNLPSRADNYLMIFIASIILAFVINLHFHNIASNGSLLHRLFLRQNPDLIVFDSLKLAFSDGIINPKVF